MRLLNIFLLSQLRKRRVEKIAENIRYLRRDAFMDDLLLSIFMANKKKPIIIDKF